MNIFIKDMHAVMKYIPVATLISLAVAFVYVFTCIARKRDIRIRRLLLYVVDVIYLVMVLEIALLSRTEGTIADIDFSLFGKYTNDLRGRMYLYENIVMTIPLGFLLPLTFPRRFKFWDVLLSSLMLSLLIEIIQLTFRCGFCQLSDVWTNLIGGIIGYILYKFFKILGGKR